MPKGGGGTVRDGRRDTKAGFAETQRQIEAALAKAMQAVAPNYGDDLKALKAAIQTLERKPAMALTSEALGTAIRQGNAEVLSALKTAAADYKAAQEKEATLLDRFAEASWIYHPLFAAFLFALGWGTGFMMSGKIAERIEVPTMYPVATAADCKVIGGTMGQDKEKRPVCHISVRP